MASWFLGNVNHTEKKLMLKGGEELVVKPGQLWTCYESMCKGTKLSQRKVRTCLTCLTKAEFLTSESTNQGTLITITNWHTYRDVQVGGDKQTDKQATSDRQAGDKQATKTNNDKNDKHEKKRDIYPDLFEQFWTIYRPLTKQGRSSKVASLSQWKKRVASGVDPQLILKCAEHYRDSEPEKEFVPSAQKWIGRDEHFREWAEPSSDSKEANAAEVERLLNERRQEKGE